MTKVSTFPDAKIILVFNGRRKFISMHSSLNNASEEMSIPAQSISLCCLGHHISCNGYYFRHLEEDKVIIVPHIDFRSLTLEQYDQMCNETRRYHHPKDMSRRRKNAEKRKKNKTTDE